MSTGISMSAHINAADIYPAIKNELNNIIGVSPPQSMKQVPDVPVGPVVWSVRLTLGPPGYKKTLTSIGSNLQWHPRIYQKATRA